MAGPIITASTIPKKSCADVIRSPRNHLWALLFAFMIFAPIWYCVLDREPPYTRIAGHISPENPMPGDSIEVDWSIKVNRVCRPASANNVARRIIDADKHSFSFDNAAGIFGQNSTLSDGRLVRQLRIPRGASLGPAVYKSTACYACNPLQELGLLPAICIDIPDVVFSIGRQSSPPH